MACERPGDVGNPLRPAEWLLVALSQSTCTAPGGICATEFRSVLCTTVCPMMHSSRNSNE